MFKTRARKVEEEAKKDPDYRPTEELEAEVPEGEEENSGYNFPVIPLVIVGVLVLIIIALLIIIFHFQN